MLIGETDRSKRNGVKIFINPDGIGGEYNDQCNVDVDFMGMWREGRFGHRRGCQ
jgi:hypothetical protein